jgi:hypothetical protein
MSEIDLNPEIISPEGDAILQDYAAKFGVNWPWTWSFTPSGEARILVNALDRLHHLLFPSSFMGRESQERYTFAHEISHAALAETVDPILSTLVFDRVTSHHSYFLQMAQNLKLVQEVADIWVDDQVVRVLGPGLVFAGTSQLMADLRLAMTQVQDPNLLPLYQLTWGITTAETERHHQRQAARRIEQTGRTIKNIYGPEAFALAQAIAQTCTALPLLTSNPAVDLTTFEHATQRLLDQLQSHMLVQIVTESAHHVWHVQQK